MKFLIVFCLFFHIHGFSQIEFVWADSVEGDFSFTEKWEYDEGIYLNQWGQLSCDGLCPMEIDPLKDNRGRIYDDSLVKFYSLIDTTHRHFTHEGKVQTFEFTGCNHAFANVLNGKAHVQTEVGISTHTSLHIVFDAEVKSNTEFKIYLIYNSVRPVKPVVFLARSGTVNISKEDFENGIIKMNFDLQFEEVSNNPEFKQTWNGRILTEIE